MALKQATDEELGLQLASDEELGLSPSSISPSQQSTKAQSKLSKIGSAAIGAAKGVGNAASQFSYGAMESMGAKPGYATEPQSLTQNVAHGAGKVAGFVTNPGGGLAAAENIAMKSVKPIIQGTKIGQVAAKAGSVAMKPAKAVGGIAKEGALDLYKLAGSWLSSRPKEMIDYVTAKELEGNSVFSGGKYKPAEDAFVGKKISKGLRHAEKSVGEIVGANKLAVKQAKENIDVEPFIEILNSGIKSSEADKVSSLTDSDFAKINYIKDMFKKGTQDEIKKSKIVDPSSYVPFQIEVKGEPAKVGRLLSIKSQIENITGYKTNEADKLSKGAQAILGRLNTEIKNYLDKNYPDLLDSYSKYAALQEARKKLGSKISDVNVEKLVRNFENQPIEIKEQLMEINDALPKKLQFMDDVFRVNARRSFDEWWPGRGGGSGSAEGIKNNIRARIIGDIASQGTNLAGKGLAIKLAWPLAPLISPRFNQAVIQGIGAASKAKVPEAIPDYLLKKSPTAMMNIMQQNQNQY